MPKWTKWITLGVLVTLPAVGFAVKRYHAAHTCPITPECPCAKK